MLDHRAGYRRVTEQFASIATRLAWLNRILIAAISRRINGNYFLHDPFDYLVALCKRLYNLRLKLCRYKNCEFLFSLYLAYGSTKLISFVLSYTSQILRSVMNMYVVMCGPMSLARSFRISS